MVRRPPGPPCRVRGVEEKNTLAGRSFPPRIAVLVVLAKDPDQAIMQIDLLPDTLHKPREYVASLGRQAAGQRREPVNAHEERGTPLLKIAKQFVLISFGKAKALRQHVHNDVPRAASAVGVKIDLRLGTEDEEGVIFGGSPGDRRTNLRRENERRLSSWQRRPM